MTSLWPFLLVALLAWPGIPLAQRWRARHTGHASIRRRWVAYRGPRRIGEYTDSVEAWKAARADVEAEP